MRERWGRSLSVAAGDTRLAYAGDVFVAAALGATAVVAPLTGDPAFGSTPGWGVVLALGSTLPVALRRRWPIEVATTLLFANGLCLIAAAPHEAALQPFVALVLSGYSV